MRRLGELLPEAAAALGLEAELRRARAAATWQRVVGERVPAAAGASWLLDMRDGSAELVVGATRPIVAQELRLRQDELLEAFARALGERKPGRLRVVVRRDVGSAGYAPGTATDVD